MQCPICGKSVHYRARDEVDRMWRIEEDGTLGELIDEDVKAREDSYLECGCGTCPYERSEDPDGEYRVKYIGK